MVMGSGDVYFFTDAAADVVCRGFPYECYLPHPDYRVPGRLPNL